MATDVQIIISAKDMASRTIKSLTEQVDQFASTARKMADIGRTLSATITAPIAAIGGAAIKMAMDAVESENLFEVSMSKMAGAARQFSEELRQQFGLNEYEVRKQVGTFNVMFTSMGLGEKAAYGMAKGLTQLAYDMSSFYNLRPEDAFIKLQAAITGEIEPLRRLGVNINEATIQAYALKKGLIEQGEQLSETGKAVARYGAIMEQMSKVHGDLARTIDSPANQLRILQEQIKQTAVDFGIALLPAFQDALKEIKPFVDKVKELVAWFAALPPSAKEAITQFTALAAVIGPASLVLSGVTKTVNILLGGLGSLVTAAGKVGFAFSAWKAGAATAVEAINFLAGSFGPFLVGGAILAGLTLIIARIAQIRESARLAATEISKIGELAEAEKVRAYWESEVKKQEAFIRAQEERRKLIESGVVGPGRAGQAFALIPEPDYKRLEEAKQKLAEVTKKIEELKKAAQVEPGADTNAPAWLKNLLAALKEEELTASGKSGSKKTIADVLKEMNEALAQAAEKEKLLGDAFDLNAEKARIFTKALDDLLNLGLKASDTRVKAISQKLQAVLPKEAGENLFVQYIAKRAAELSGERYAAWYEAWVEQGKKEIQDKLEREAAWNEFIAREAAEVSGQRYMALAAVDPYLKAQAAAILSGERYALWYADWSQRYRDEIKQTLEDEAAKNEVIALWAAEVSGQRYMALASVDPYLKAQAAATISGERYAAWYEYWSQKNRDDIKQAIEDEAAKNEVIARWAAEVAGERYMALAAVDPYLKAQAAAKISGERYALWYEYWSQKNRDEIKQKIEDEAAKNEVIAYWAAVISGERYTALAAVDPYLKAQAAASLSGERYALWYETWSQKNRDEIKQKAEDEAALNEVIARYAAEVAGERYTAMAAIDPYLKAQAAAQISGERYAVWYEYWSQKNRDEILQAIEDEAIKNETIARQAAEVAGERYTALAAVDPYLRAQAAAQLAGQRYQAQFERFVREHTVRMRIEFETQISLAMGEPSRRLELEAEAIRSNINEIVSSMASAGKSSEQIQSEIDPLLQRLRSLSQRMREMRMAAELVDSFLSGVAEGLREAGTAWADFMATVVSSIKISIDETGLSIDWTTTLVNIAKPGLQQLGQAIVDLFAGAGRLRQEYPYGAYGEVNYPDLARMRQNYLNWGQNLQALQQAQQAQATMTVGGGLFGGIIGFLFGGPIGALIGAGIGAGAGYAAGQAIYGKQIEELKKKLEDTFQKIADTLGTTISNVADALGNAFSAETYQEFLNGFATNLESVVKQALIKAFMAGEAMRPLLQKLSDFITVAVWDGVLDASEKLKLAEMFHQIVGVAQPFWEALQEFDFAEAVGAATDALGEFSEALRNAPSGFKIALTRWDAASPIPMASGGIVTRPTYALIGEAGPEAVVPLNRGEVGHMEIHIHGDVYGWDDFRRKVAEAEAANRRSRSLAGYGIVRAGVY